MAGSCGHQYCGPFLPKVKSALTLAKMLPGAMPSASAASAAIVSSENMMVQVYTKSEATHLVSTKKSAVAMLALLTPEKARHHGFKLPPAAALTHPHTHTICTCTESAREWTGPALAPPCTDAHGGCGKSVRRRTDRSCCY